MPHNKLNHLPIEALINIASLIDKPPEPDLSSFALAGKSCNAAAAYFLFQEIHIRLTTPKKLRQDVARWLTVLRRNSYERHVRLLDVKFDFATKSPPGPWEFMHMYTRETHWQFDRRVEYEVRLQFGAPGAWDPLVELLCALPGLRQLAVDHDTSFSRQLIETLGSHHSECRLDLRRFNMLPLYVAMGNRAPIDRHDVALLLVAQLHEIGIDEYSRDSGSRRVPKPLHVNEIALRELLLAGLVPNLKAVHIGPNVLLDKLLNHYQSVVSDAPRFRELLSQELGRHSSRPQGRATGVINTGIGSLNSLTLYTPGVRRLDDWLEATDPTRLRRLELFIDMDEYNILDKGRYSLLSFTELELHLNPLVSLQEPEYWKKQFPKLPPLTYLSLVGIITPISFKAAVDSLGSSLRRLKLKPSIRTRGDLSRPVHLKADQWWNRELLTLLPEGCPLLEELVVENSDLGDGADWSICESLGQNKNLRTLSVKLGSSTEDKALATAAWHVIRRQGCQLERLLVNGCIEVRRAGFGDYEAVTVRLRRGGKIREPQGGKDILKVLYDGGPVVPCDPEYRPLNCSAWNCPFRHSNREGCSQWGHIGETEMRMIEAAAQQAFLGDRGLVSQGYDIA
ncbi:hypothetical protein CkaCkLH20_01024 [Colletotrichum karsti]|uniref:Uncharacterized protein n=1 Tax=Colletotrichum karsti TaxID=1095194 RepID=A0A9P6LQ42_9PEZI|nr:uncharacterized protein CkaCkLH20_01024 [Colletotrichum karsti]KAF9881878.1 hypothetical protein CkaCkLH20_01024 [Colletotrichum karsti]